MSEDQLGQESLFWDVDWEFPNSSNGGQKPAGNSDLRLVAPPPAPNTSKGKKRKAAGKGSDGQDRGEEGKIGSGDKSDDHELHIWTERERRKKMRSMFENLHALLPHLAPKADKSTIVDEAVSYIKKLEHTLHTLQKQKLQKLHGILITTNTTNYENPLTIAQQNLANLSREAFLAEQLSGSTASNPNPLISNSNYEIPAIFKTWTSPNVILNVCGKEAQMSICSLKKSGLLAKICFVMDKNKLEVVSAHVSTDCYRCMYMIHARLASGCSEQYQQAFGVEEMYKQAAAEIMLWVNS
ncbi:Transcription factor bHLH95 [Striga hermonthica]|uniref:Transcription factor bHLH95 n=1 Tax=Striga hermonthica TaxID=68872 RepID=A0A9N7RE70_STRHE|nr:Transcription factor bHLH95 [Striga hermonthica]